MSKRWILLFTLFGAFGLAIFLWRSPPREFSDFLEPRSEAPSYPSAYISQARTKQYNNQGKLSYLLEAETINYYEDRQPNQPEIILQQPFLTIFNYDDEQTDSHSITTLSANTAEGSEREDQLTLISNVKVKQTGIDGQITTLTTERLTIQPNRRYAETDKPVIIADNTGTTSATGLKVFFDEKRIELLSNVKGKYVPQ